MEKQIFTISNISCGHCVAAIQNELQELDVVTNIAGDPQGKTIMVKWESPATASQIESKLAGIGYPSSA